MINKLLFLGCLCFYASTALTQIPQLFPIYDSTHKLMDADGKIVGELPEGYKIVNKLDGSHSGGWMLGMPSLDIGQCGNIVAVNRDKGEVSFFDTSGKRKGILPKILFTNVSPCNNGFYLAQFKKENQYGITRYAFLDANRQIVFNQKGYYKATIFSEGLAAVRESGKGWSFINDLGHHQDIIPDSLKKISEVGAFKSGLSRLQSDGEKVGFYFEKIVYFINKEGEIKIDLKKIFPDKKVMRCSDFNDGIACIKFDKPKTKGFNGDDIAYINAEGKVIAHFPTIEGYRPHGSGYISFMKFEGKGNPYSAHLYDVNGNSITLPEKASSIHHISNQFFWISSKLSESEMKTVFFDAKKGKVVHESTGGKCMGAMGNLMAFQLSKTKRFYVIDLSTGDIIYDTDIKALRIVGLDGFDGKLEDITNFVTSREAELNKIPEMINLEELTIKGVTSKVVPDLSKLSKLKVLRLEDCRNFKKLPEGLNSIKQLSLRSCTSIDNLEIALYSMPSVSKLFVLNMDVSQNDKRKIKARISDSYFSGDAKSADYELQEVVPGFE